MLNVVMLSVVAPIFRYGINHLDLINCGALKLVRLELNFQFKNFNEDQKVI